MLNQGGVKRFAATPSCLLGLPGRSRGSGSWAQPAPKPRSPSGRGPAAAPGAAEPPGAALGRPLPGQPRLRPAPSAPPGARGTETTDPGGQEAAPGSSFQLLAAGFGSWQQVSPRIPRETGAERCCLLTAPSPSLLPSLFTTSSSSTSTD